MLDKLKYIILGIIQGLTEPLPISSSGHLVIFKNLFNLDSLNDLNFEIIVNFASFLAISFIYRKDIIKLIKDSINYLKTKNYKYYYSFKYILLIEKSLKSKISYTVSENYGVETKLNDYNTPTDYLNRKNYRNNAQRDNILSQIKESTIKSKDESIRHYKNNHNHLPCWILINGISFGLTIKWYNILKPVNKDYVCENIVHNEDLTLDQKKEFLNKGLTILRRYRNNIAHGHKIFTGNIKEELPKNQVLIVSNGLISNKDYLNGIGKNDLFAVIIIMATLLNKRYKDMFLFEIVNILEGFEKLELSTGKGILEILSLPNDFIDKLKQLKEK